MLLQAPPETPYDLNFRCLGFPVRVSAWFWLGALMFGYSLTLGMNRLFQGSGPGQLPLLLVWMGCLFLSILVHELGHALAFRRYGIESSIVLYHFGGLAIPGRSTRSPGRSAGSLSPKEDIVVALAGPGLQIASALLVTAIIKFSGYGLSFTQDGMVYGFGLWPMDLIPGFSDGAPIDSPGLFALVMLYLMPSFLWALLNLLPVLPLDGGRVVNAIVQSRRGPRALSIQISLITAVGVAVYAYGNGDTYLAMMFAMLAFSSYQMLQPHGGNGY